MILFCRTSATVAVFISLAFIPTLKGADPAVLTDSPAANKATMTYEKDVEAAQQEFQKKLHLLRQDYESRTTTARKVYAASLKTAQAEETKKGMLEVALAIKEQVTKIEGEGSPTWPKQTLPEAVSAVDPTVADKRASGKAVPASKGYTFDFSNEKKLREWWALPTDPTKWQSTDEGLELHGGIKEFDSSFTWTGEASIQMLVQIPPAGFEPTPAVHVYGEDIKLPFGGSMVTIERRGDKLFATFSYQVKVKDEGGNAKPQTFNIKDSQKDLPTHLHITFSGKGMTIKGMRITTKELKVEPPMPIGKP